MAQDGGFKSKGVPLFSSSGAFEDWVDLEKVGDYAARVGNRIVGTAAERTTLSASTTAEKQRWEGLEFYETDTKKTFLLVGGVWKRSDIKVVRFNNTTATSPAGMLSVAHNYGEVPGAITVTTNPVDPGNAGFVEMARRAHAVVWDSPLGANSVQLRFANVEGTDWYGGIGIAGWITVYPNI